MRSSRFFFFKVVTVFFHLINCSSGILSVPLVFHDEFSGIFREKKCGSGRIKSIKMQNMIVLYKSRNMTLLLNILAGEWKHTDLTISANFFQVHVSNWGVYDSRFLCMCVCICVCGLQTFSVIILPKFELLHAANSVRFVLLWACWQKSPP